MPTNIGNRLEISRSNISCITDADGQRLERYLVKAGDIVYSRRGDVEKCAFITKKEDGWLCGTGCLRIRFESKNVIPRFIAYYLSTDEIKGWVSGNAVGTTMPNLNSSILRRLPLSIPTYKEQKSIASVLSSLDDKIDLLHRQNKTLEAMAETLFRQWFVEEAGDWEVGKIEDLFVLQRGYDLPLKNRSSGKYPIFASSGFSGYHCEYKVKAPGITTGRSGVLGNVFLVLEDFWPLNTSLYIKEFKRATPLFAYYILKSLDLNSYNAGSAVPTLNRNHVHEASVLIPPDNLILEFESIASLLFKRIKTNEIQIRQIEIIRDGLLPKLMSGEVRVSHA